MNRLKWSPFQNAIAIASMLYMVVFIAMIVLHPGSDKFYQAFHNTYQIVPPLLAAVCSFMHALRGRHSTLSIRLGWGIIGASCAAFAFGQAAWTVIESVMGQEVPYPGVPDFGYASAGPLMALGVCFLFGSLPVVGRARLLMDSGIAASGAGVFVWYFIASKWVEQITSPQNRLENILSAAYPLLDVASLFSAFMLLGAAGSNRNLRHSAAWLSGGVAMLLFADCWFSYYNLNDMYATGSWFDWGWSFGWLAIAYASLAPMLWPSAELPGKASVVGVALPTVLAARGISLVGLVRVTLPYLFAAVCFGVVLKHDIEQGTKDVTSWVSNQVLVLGGWLIALVTIRQVFTLLENQQLTNQLKSLNTTLEQKVAQRTEQLSSLLHLTKAVNLTRKAERVLSLAGQHAREVLRADAVVFWSAVSDRPELTIAAHAHPEATKQQFPALIKFLSAYETVTDGVSLPLSAVPPAPRVTAFARGAMAPTMGAETPAAPVMRTFESGQILIAPMPGQESMVGMVAAVRFTESFETDDLDVLESIGVEVGTALENARRYAAAMEAADRDPVTSLFNHRAIHQRLDEEFLRAQRLERPISVIMMDLNNFKLFNDTYGHPVGDQVLKRVARALEAECRKYDVLGRYGGDEFIAVLPDTDSPLALVLAQRLADRMSREGFQRSNDATTVPITLAFGVASYPEDSSNRFELVTVADHNLYTAKLSENGIVGTTESQRSHRALRAEGSFDVLDAMVTAVDNKDRYTRRHSEDVTEYALWVAEELGYSEATQRVIRIGGLLHDVGKIGVPEDILRKPGHLSDEEYETMKRHTQLGALIVGGVPGMESIIDIVRFHHERWDGAGYPDKLAGEDIPLLGRLLAVADAFSAMTTDRPYRRSLGWDTAMAEIRKGSGSQFDPEMAQAFLAAASRRHAGGRGGLDLLPGGAAGQAPTDSVDRFIEDRLNGDDDRDNCSDRDDKRAEAV